MTIQMYTSGDGAEEDLRSLYAWLLDEPDVRRHAHVSLLHSQADPGEMGSGLAILQLVADDGFQLANLALAYLAWRGTHRKKSKVAITRGDIKVTLPDDDPQAIARIIEALDPKAP